MATIMTWQDRNGRRRQCDGRCHNTKGPAERCHCMCGGRFHGGVRNGTLDRLLDERARETFDAIRSRCEEAGVELTVVNGFEFPLLDWK